MERSEQLRDAYNSTIITIRNNGNIFFQTSPSNPSEFEWPFENSVLFLVSAWNPRSKRLSSVQNSELNKELKLEIDRLKVIYFDFRGQGASSAWYEDGFAISSVNQSFALELGAKYGQNAIFRVEDQKVEVLDCLHY